jgi:hypothetical protein
MVEILHADADRRRDGGEGEFDLSRIETAV